MGPLIPGLFAKYSIDSLDWKIYFNSLMAQGSRHRRRLFDLRRLGVDDEAQGRHGGHQLDRPEARALQQAPVDSPMICIITLITLVVVPALPG